MTVGIPKNHEPNTKMLMRLSTPKVSESWEARSPRLVAVFPPPCIIGALQYQHPVCGDEVSSADQLLGRNTGLGLDPASLHHNLSIPGVKPTLCFPRRGNKHVEPIPQNIRHIHSKAPLLALRNRALYISHTKDHEFDSRLSKLPKPVTTLSFQGENKH